MADLKVNFRIDDKEVKKLLRLGKTACFLLIVLDWLTLRLMHHRIQIQIDEVARLISVAVAESIEVTYETKD